MSVQNHISPTYTDLEDILDFDLPEDSIIFDSFVKADSVINHKGYNKICCCVSGGE